jgi:mycothiol synthase
MKKYSVRPASPADIEHAYTLIANQNMHDYGEAMLTLDDLRRSWQSIHFETDTCAAYADGVLQGYAELKEDSPFIYLAESNNIDLAFQLLTILEDIAIERRISTLSTRLSVKNQTLSELFLVNGYRSTLSFLMMQTILSDPPALPSWPEGITVRYFVCGQDEQATFQADEEASQDKGYHEPFDYAAWSKRMGIDGPRFDPSLWFLACEGDQIAGVSLNVYDSSSHSGWIDHLGVRAAWRKRGIGKALLLYSFGEFYRRGVRCIKLRVDAQSKTNATHLYESVGMLVTQQYHIYKKDLPV